MIGKVWLQQKWAVYEIRDEFNFFFLFYTAGIFEKYIKRNRDLQHQEPSQEHVGTETGV